MVNIKLKLSLKITSDEENILGPGIIKLLQLIDREQSLRRAAKTMALSYSKAWRIINVAETHWGFALTEKKIGGEHGGQSSLTAQARDLIRRYEIFEEETRKMAELLFEQYFNLNTEDQEEDHNEKN